MLRRIHSIVLLFVLLIGSAGMNYVQAAKLTGTCGAPGNEANVTWEYNEFGIKPVYIGWVIIRGTGPMMDFADYTQTPWYSKRARIVSVYVTQGVTTIGNNTFGGLYRVENVTIPHGVTSIGQNAFAGCSALTKVSIPHTVTSIGSGAFSSTNLTTLYVAWQNSIPAWVNLSDRTSQVTMHVPCGKTALYQAAAGWNNYNIADGPYYGTCSAGGNTDLPDWTLNCTGTLTIQADDAQMIDWYDLNAIPWYTIRGSIKRVVISGGVKSLGHHAFYDSQNITSVSLNPRLEKIGVLAFGFCRKLTSITIPNAVTSIGGMAFWYNESLTDVYVSWLGDAVPEMPSDIHNYEASRIRLHVPCSEPYIAKGWNTKFTLVVDQPLPSGTCGAQGNNLTWALDCNGTFTVSGSGDMADYSFYTAPWSQYMTSVQSVSISEGVTHIGNYAFYDSSIRSVNLPNSVTSIGNDAFAYCDKLTTVTIPSSVTSIGSLAFYGSDCPLTDIYVNWTTTATIPTWSNTTYTSNQSQVRLHVPCGTTAQYQAAKGWQNFIIVEEPYRGTCGAQGDNLTWSLSCDGTLTISGTGAMRHFWTYETDIPWWNYRGSIQRIVIEEGVTTIGNHAFVHCSNLTSVSLPNTLTAISVLAFGHCTSLPTLVIPSSVTSMAGMFIHNTPSLTDVYVSWTGDAVPDMPTDIHPHDASQKRLHIPCGQTAAYVAKGWNTKFTIDGVVSGTCGDNVQWTFESCNGTLTIRGTGAMRHFWTYETDIPWWNYRGSIQRIVIEEGVTTIGNHAFVQCSNLTSVSLPNTLTAISVLAFGHCTSLPSLTIPSSVTSMAGMFIHNTPSLTDVYVSWTGDAVPDMPADIHPHDASQKRLHIPCGQAANYIAKGWNTKFTIDGVASGTCGTNVQWHFDPCTGVLSLSGTGAMADYTAGTAPWYSYRESIITADIAIGITYVGKSAFSGCSALDDIYVYWTTADAIPAWNNGNAMMITLHVPCGTRDLYKAKNGWKDMYVHDELGHGTCGAQGNNLTWRLYCEDWLYIRGAGDMDNWSSPSVVPWSSLRTSIQKVDIGDGVTSTGFHAFYNASNLTSVYLPSTLQTLEYMTFCGCSSLPSLIIPSSVTKVGNRCLQGCAALTDVYVYWTGDDVPTMPVEIHEYDASRIKLHIPCGQEAAYTAKGWNNKFTIEVIDSGTCGANVQWTFDPCTGALSITGTGAMTDFDFYTGAPWKPYRNYITSTTIADGITNIGQYSFYACSALTSVTIPNSVTSIGIGVFDGCSSLASISIPNSVTSIGDNAFYECSSLTSVVIPNGVTSIEYSLFAQCSSLTSVTIPNSVTSIGYLAFWGCSALTSVSIPNSVTSIEHSAFWDCSSLTSIIIPNSVTSIENSSFDGCTSLTSVTIPNSVTKIGLFAFDDCHSITDIYVSWTTTAAIPTWNYLNNKTPRSSINLHVPCGTTAQYQAKGGWNGCTILEGPYRGACGAQGDNLIWELTCDGVLTISGTGEMYNWMSLADRPWHSLCTSIQRVVIEEGVTTTGFHAFYGAANLTSVSLPSTLQTLQFMTFFGCSKLTTLTIPSSVTYVGNRSLEGCAALTDVYTSWSGDNVPTMPVGIHTYDASRIRLHIPCGQAGAYFAKGWNTKFTLEQENTHYTITVESDDLSMGTVDAQKL